jgi:hypothetical protein
MSQVGFKSTVPEGERPQTHAIDRAATGIDTFQSTTWKFTLHVLYMLTAFIMLPFISFCPIYSVLCTHFFFDQIWLPCRDRNVPSAGSLVQIKTVCSCAEHDKHLTTAIMLN